RPIRPPVRMALRRRLDCAIALTPPLVFTQRTVSKYRLRAKCPLCQGPVLVTRKPMNPHRKRTTRLVVSLSAALLLAAALIYTSFSASSEARTPSQLRDAPAGRAYQLTGRVVPGYHREGDVLVFRVRDRNGPASAPSVPVRYAGAVPDPFR